MAENNNNETVRVLRVIEYVGPRAVVEAQVTGSVQTKRLPNGLTITGATIGNYPEVLTGQTNENVTPPSTQELVSGLLDRLNALGSEWTPIDAELHSFLLTYFVAKELGETV